MDVLNMRSTMVDWQESQARESSPMRVIFTRLQKQLSSRSMKCHFSAPLIGTLRSMHIALTTRRFCGFYLSRLLKKRTPL